MKQIKDFRLFKKVVRKYWKKYARKTYSYYKGKKITSYWTDKEWCYFLVNKPEMLDKEDIMDRFLYDVHYEDYLKNKDLWKSLLGKEINAIWSDKGINSGILDSFVLTNNGAWIGLKNFIAFDGRTSNPDCLELLPFCYTLTERTEEDKKNDTRKIYSK